MQAMYTQGCLRWKGGWALLTTMSAQRLLTHRRPWHTTHSLATVHLLRQQVITATSAQAITQREAVTCGRMYMGSMWSTTWVVKVSWTVQVQSMSGRGCLWCQAWLKK